MLKTARVIPGGLFVKPTNETTRAGPWAFPFQNQLHYQQAHERNRETNCDFERPTHGGILCRTFMSASKRMPYWGSWQESKSFLSFASRRIYTRNSTHIEHAKASNL